MTAAAGGVAPFDAFLSYASGDAAWAGRVKSALEARGVRVWLDIDRLRPGDLVPGALARGIGEVRCLVLIVSPGSAASRWVQEEYGLALARGLHIVPVLVADAEPPGFLLGRSWVDFRDEAQFDASLEQLVFGITGRRPADAAPTSSFRDHPVEPGADETVVIERLIARRRRDARRLHAARGASAAGSVTIGLSCFAATPASPMEIRIAASIVAALVMMLAGWGVTATGLARLARKVEQFELLRDGLEACRARSHPGCTRLRQHFWDMMVRNAADAGMDVSSV